MLPNFRVIYLLNIFYSSFNSSNDSSVSLFIRHSENTGRLLILHCPFLITMRDHLNIYQMVFPRNISWPSEGYPYTLHFGSNLEGPIRSIPGGLQPQTPISWPLEVTDTGLSDVPQNRTLGAPRTKDHLWAHIPGISWVKSDSFHMTRQPQCNPWFRPSVTSLTFQACH